MSITLTREEYVEYVCLGHEEEYPMSTDEAAQELKRMGYGATETRLNYYVKQGRVTPGKDGGRNLKWYPKDIDAAAAILAEEDHYAPEAWMNRLMGVSYGQRMKALWDAWKALEKEFPGQLPVNADADYFVMHVHPPTKTHDGWVEFTPCEDIVKQLKAGRPAARASGIKRLAVRKDEIEAEEAEMRKKGGK